MPTKEEAMLELQRRRTFNENPEPDIQDQNMPSYAPQGNQSHGIMDTEIQLPEWMQDWFPGLVHGANKSFADIYGFGPHVDETRQRAAEAEEYAPTATSIGRGIGNVGAALPFAVAGGTGILGSAAAGGAYGAAQRPEEGESRLGNAAKDAALWAALPTIIAGYGGAKSLGNAAIEALAPTKLSQPKTINQVSQLADELSKHFNSGYSEIVTHPMLPDVVQVGLTPKTIDAIKTASPKLGKSVSKAVHGTDVSRLHDTATQLGKFIQKEQASANPSRATIETAQVVKNKVEKAIDKALDTVPGLKESYRGLDKEFADTLGKFGYRLRNSLKNYSKDDIGFKDVMRKIREPEGGQFFRHAYGEQFPGIEGAQHAETWKNLPAFKQTFNLYEKYLGGKK